METFHLYISIEDHFQVLKMENKKINLYKELNFTQN